MRIRAGIILISENKLAFIKRVKAGKTYYVIPGGGLDDGEYTDEAAIREAQEELGVTVEVSRLLFMVERVEHQKVTHLQMYYLVNKIDDMFGSGTGEEYQRPSERGTYEAVWLHLDELEKHDCYPSVITNFLQEHGLPKNIVHFKEAHNYPK